MMILTPLERLFVGLSLGYFICVAAKKHEGILKSVGYTIGISMIVLSLGWALVSSVFCPYYPMERGMHKMMGGYKGMKMPMMKTQYPMMK